MQTSQIIASVLALVPLVLGGAAPGSVPASPSTASTPTTSVYGPNPADLPALYTPPPGPIREVAHLSGDVTIGITNILVGVPTVTIVGTYDAGALPPLTLIDGQFTATTNIVVPSGWAGAFTLNQVGDTFNNMSGRIEGNWGVNDPYSQVYVDVSYVNGWSFAMVCSCGTDPAGTPVTGCNKLLSALDTCPAAQKQGSVCTNPAPAGGPPTEFFAPCQGAAYTYAGDNGGVGICNTNNVSCCLGKACPSPPRQSAGPIIKRDIVGLMAAQRGLDIEA